MIIDSLTVNNFGVFKGQQTISLAPRSAKKPVVLIGGLNGCGKTTLLEAVQLALYGRIAPFIRDSRGSYEKYLRSAINRQSPPEDGASVKLTFRSHQEGKKHSVCLKRMWSVNGSTSEDLYVSVNGKYDELLSETWIEQVEHYVPARLSQLFFFDGERIETLADSEQSKEVLITGIHALLGVDLVDQLNVDLLTIERKKQKSLSSTIEREAIEKLEESLSEATLRLEQQNQMAAALRAKIGHAEKQCKEKERELAREGGDLLKSRKCLELKYEGLKKDKRLAEENLIRLASSVLPLALVRKQIYATVLLAQSEIEANDSRMVCDILRKRDQRIARKAKRKGLDAKALAVVKEVMQAELPKPPATSPKASIGLASGPIQLAQLLLSREGLQKSKREAKRYLVEFSQLQDEIDEVNRKLSAIPDEDTVQPLVSGLNSAKDKLNQLKHELTLMEDEVNRSINLRDMQRSKLDNALRSVKVSELSQQDDVRIVKHSSALRGSLELFRRLIVDKHSKRLEEIIAKSFRRLLRKQKLINKVKIDPQTCEIRLFNKQDEELMPSQLSAGERQLFAVSILWGLGQAADRLIPVIVDTPLGRLDASHREHIVSRYFPKASHQVILLSTDEEIDENYLEMLKPSIGRSYVIKHDDKTQCSVIDEGYFWKDN